MGNQCLLPFVLASVASAASFTQIVGPPNYFGGSPANSRGVVAFVGPNGSVWTANADGTALKKVIDSTTVIPTSQPAIPFGNSQFTPYTPASGDSFSIGYGNQLRIGGGMLVFVATDPATAGTLSGIGLYSVPIAGGPITALASGKGFPFDFQVSDSGQVVFEYESQVYTVPASGGPITTLAANQALSKPPSLIVNSGSTAQANQFAYPAISGSNVVLNAGNNGSGGSIQTTTTSGSGTFVDIADGRQFDVFGFTNPKIDGTTVLFGGVIRSSGIRGIYSSSGPGQFVTLVDSTMAVPGGNGKFTLTPDIRVSDGMVVFRSTDGNGNVGIYEVSEAGGPITKVLAVGDSIGGDLVQNVDMGAQAFSGSKLALNVAIHFDHVLIVADLSGTTPAIMTDGTGVMNGATNQPNSAVVAGSWVTIKGSAFSDKAMDSSKLDFSNGLPTSLNGVQVLFNGEAAATYYVQGNQINVQAPSNVPSSGSVSVQVVRNNVPSNVVTATAASVAPGPFPYSIYGKIFFPAAVFQDGTLVGDPALYGASRKAKSGDVVLLFATGLGVSPAGVLVSPTPFTSPVQVLVDNTPATVTAVYLVAPGEWQINIVDPGGLSDGNRPIVLQTGEVSSQQGVVIPITH